METRREVLFRQKVDTWPQYSEDETIPGVAEGAEDDSVKLTADEYTFICRAVWIAAGRNPKEVPALPDIRRLRSR
jgi:hypothetical protein